MSNSSRFVRGMLFLWLAGVGFFAVWYTAAAQMGGNAGAFTGAWCAQGDRSKQASISSNGAFLNLTNENGDSSIGNLRGSNQIVAPGWQFVSGTLTGDGKRINWSNGTFWARCSGGGGGHGGGGYSKLNLNGTWYKSGNRSLSCTIQQRHNALNLQNESGQSATGSVDGKRLRLAHAQ